MEKIVSQYLKTGGRGPFREWLLALRDVKARAKIRARLARARAGNIGDSKALGGGIYEMRVDFGPGYRVYFGQGGAESIVLLCGGDKSEQERDVETAREYWADYLERKNEPDSRLPRGLD
ncbi:MAG: type II toxin-antitoxin system RelE/ParE family toxin [Desulfovibrionaceae bacterium]|nr:type II toxin-antitoxin system RelE/ParE family toxin [Desulfovibrionaceae bacterium]MBF0512808.1 type II toxin-antitoxin system RelE/ParE family toxin [Desulfovibrionaceae bacterium]